MIGRFVVHRLAIGAAQLAVLVVALFFLIRLLPADPVARFVGLNATPEAYALAEARLGLDRPVTAQFGDYAGGLLRGDLGTSWVSGVSVGREIAAFLPVTLELILLAFLVAILVGIPVGMLGAAKPGGAADKGTLIYGLFAGSQPEFTWGILFILIFFVGLDVAPGPVGRLSPLTEPPGVVTGFMTIDSLIAGRPALFVEALRYLALPVLTLAFVLSGPIIKMVRENVGQALAADFTLYARASGLPERTLAREALRAAFAPSMTLIGVLFGFMLGGAVLVETIFSLGGLGQYAIRSILAFDYPAIQGVVLVISAISLAVYLLLDIAHALLDPRVAL
jgi:ABC-type dipeptide/oligopeptide/nickel transport system permease component